MGQDVSVRAAHLLQCVGQHSEPCGFKHPDREGAVVVGGLSESDDGWCLPGGGNGGRAEGVEDVSYELTLDFIGNKE
jgi:hypothetical protein